MRKTAVIFLVCIAGTVYSQEMPAAPAIEERAEEQVMPPPADTAKTVLEPVPAADTAQPLQEAAPAADTVRPLQEPVQDAPDTTVNIGKDPAAVDSTNKAAAADTVQKPLTEQDLKKREIESFYKKEDVVIAYSGSSNDYRHPKKALLKSLMLPGYGEYWADAPTWRWVAPIAIEVGLIGTIIYERYRGNEARDRYEGYADEHFSQTRYADWYNWVETEEAEVIGTEYFGHREAYLDEKDSRGQQYYEMIGKYNEFVQGWDDADPDMSSDKWRRNVGLSANDPDKTWLLAIRDITEDDDTVWYYVMPEGSAPADKPAENKIAEAGDRVLSFGYSPHQVRYMKMREVADGFYERSRYLLFGIVATHFASGINAVFAALSHNNSLKQDPGAGARSPEGRIRMEHVTVRGTDGNVNGLALCYRF